MSNALPEDGSHIYEYGNLVEDIDDGSGIYDNLVKDIEEVSKKVHPSLLCAIFKVPEKLRKLNEEAYTPHYVSIGPFHHGKKGLNFMESQKVRYLKTFCDRKFIGLKDLVKESKKQEHWIRGYYSEMFDELSSDKFVKIILVDAIFILELFYRTYYKEYREEDKTLQSNPWVFNGVVHDLILLENQLPYAFLEFVYKIVYWNHIAEPPSFFMLFFGFFGLYHLNTDDVAERTHECEDQNFKHFTDILRLWYKPPHQILPPHRSDKIHSASNLHEAGVKFSEHRKSSNKGSSSRYSTLLQAEFDVGVLTMGRIQVEEKTESLLRNLMALEQCFYSYDTYICHYAALLDNLIDTSKDVDLLVEANILSHRLGSSNAVVSLVNKLCINIETSDETSQGCSNQKGLYEKMNEYYDKPLHKWKAIFIHEYFNTPFKIASTSTAVIFLVLTFIQTIFAIVKI